MRQIKRKYERMMKYWRISYQQSSGRDRLLMGGFALMMLAYFWWSMLPF